MEGVKVSAHILLGMVVGGMAAVHHFKEHDNVPPFISSLRSRLRILTTAFDKVGCAQVKISGINTALTAVYTLRGIAAGTALKEIRVAEEDLAATEEILCSPPHHAHN